MPYRRLPNTDTARIATLEKAIGMEIGQTPDRQPASFKTLNLTANRQEIRFIIAGLYLDICRLQNQAHVITDNIALSDTLLAPTALSQ